MSPYDKEPTACEGCEKLQQELNEMEERLDRERRYSDDVRAEVERVLADAERYRWLRDQCDTPTGTLTVAEIGGWSLQPWSGDDLDAAIDAARGES